MKSSWHIEGRIPPIKAVMRPFPFSTAADVTVAAARATMTEHGIRHLPVLDGESLVGIVSDRDLRGVDGGLPVQRVMSSPVIHVDMERPLDTVLMALAEGRIGSVLVTRAGRVAGIFTKTDACRLLGEAFAPLAGPGGDGDGAA